jgi:hypothetical protein
VAERDLPYKVPELRYVEVDPRQLGRLRSNLNNWWGDQTPIALCVRCELRYTEDPNRDAWGLPMHEDPEDDLEVVCSDCHEEAFTDILKRGMEEILDERLDFDEEDRAALKKVVELVVTEPEKVLELKDLGNKVRDLEKQNGRLWIALGIEGGLLAVLITSVLAIAIAIAY